VQRGLSAEGTVCRGNCVQRGLSAEGNVCGGFKRDNKLLVQKLTAEDFRLLKAQLLLTVRDFRRFESLQ
jgi:hypothetical protein